MPVAGAGRWTTGAPNLALPPGSTCHPVYPFSSAILRAMTMGRPAPKLNRQIEVLSRLVPSVTLIRHPVFRQQIIAGEISSME